MCRVRIPGDSCLMCTKKRIQFMAALKPIRGEIKKPFGEFHGDDYGVAIGLTSDGPDIQWFDVILAL